VLERWGGGKREIGLPEDKSGWLVPIRGEGVVGGVAWRAGECVMVTGPELLHASEDADLLFAYTGTSRI
jgi:mannose-6-phosphate isomerase